MTTAQNTPGVFGTLGVAMITPFTEDLTEVDHSALASVTQHLLETGHDMLVVNGTTGESPTTSDSEKLAILQTVRKAAGPDVTIVMGVGSNSTRHTVDLARATAATGMADGLLVVTPYYNKPTQEGVRAHVAAVAAATSLPIMLYDIPGRAGIPLTWETSRELARIPTVKAIKEAKGDIHGGSDIMRITDLEIYSGEDALNLPWMAVGASGIVSVVSHVTGALDRIQLDAALRGDLITAQRIHHARIPYIDAIMNQVPGAVAVKHALHHLGVIPHPGVRLPLTPADESQVARINASTDALPGILAPFQKAGAS